MRVDLESIERYEDHPAYEVICDDKNRRKGLRRFLAWSFLGVMLFIFPIHWQGNTTILVGLMGDTLKNFLGKDLITIIALFFVSLSFLGATVFKLLKFFGKEVKSPALVFLFDPEWVWYIARFLGVVFIWMVYLKKGLPWIYDANTGGVLLYDLMPALLPLWLFAFMLLPALTDYGLMEYAGTILRKPFEKLFKIPGRAAIDAISSWFGAVSVGVMLTITQYDKGYYTQREAAVIATTFSVASIAFSYVVADTIGVANQFAWFYFAIVVSGVVLAIIMPRIPPLSLKKQSYINGGGKVDETMPKNISTTRWALMQATYRAYKMPSAGKVFRTGFLNLCEVYLGLVPAVIAMGTLGLVLTEYTPIFNYLAAPLVPYLELLRLPEAKAAAPAILVGFADMFLPALVGRTIESEITRFVVGASAIIQIIYLSEVGVLLLKSKIKINIFEIFAIFLLRVVLALPILSLVAHCVYG